MNKSRGKKVSNAAIARGIRPVMKKEGWVFKLPLSAKRYRFLGKLLYLLFLGTFYLCAMLPNPWGWENGPIEWAQCIVLAIGIFFMVRFAIQAPDLTAGRFWRWLAPFLLILIGRETNWGAAFLPFLNVGAHGPVLLPLKSLWYGQAVYPILAIILLIEAVLFFKYRLYKALRQMTPRGHFSELKAEIMITLSALLLSNWAETKIVPILAERRQIFEESMELVFYFGIITIFVGINYLNHQKIDSQPQGSERKVPG